ncbi:MAG: type II toxin-antitoxin system RelE/ParE family toxin [Betaproteobacteria bacterium]|nr:type II toxin-antitoxin system RelE/ParE family toxin [Betaproteobacteria bacterium]
MTDAALFYELAAPSLGHDFLDDIQHAIDTVLERPELGAPVAHGFRRVLVRRFPYSLIYAVEVGHIVVVAVAHQRRRPGFWKGRL